MSPRKSWPLYVGTDAALFKGYTGTPHDWAEAISFRRKFIANSHSDGTHLSIEVERLWALELRHCLPSPSQSFERIY